jgi:flagellin-like hook-associated protein FlgL
MLARSQILVQAGVSVLSQANQTPQAALKLLG